MLLKLAYLKFKFMGVVNVGIFTYITVIKKILRMMA